MGSPGIVIALATPAFAWAVLQVVYYWPRMPERMASHFNFKGEPDGWMERGALVGVYGVTMVVLGVVVLSFVGLVLLPVLYLMPAVFHFAFAFNARPGTKRLSRWVWVFIAVFMLAMAGLPFLLR